MRVLLADDDERALAFLANHLKARGYSVTTAQDGFTALNAVERDPGIRVVILNWMMPDLDSWRVSRQLKACKARGVYTIVVVGRHFCQEIKERFPSWADEYISKPFDLQGLAARLHTAVRSIGVLRSDARSSLPLKRVIGHNPKREVRADPCFLVHSTLCQNWN